MRRWPVPLLGAVLFRVFGNRSEILKSGIEGEKQAMDALKVLPYSYHVVSNPVYYIQRPQGGTGRGGHRQKRRGTLWETKTIRV